MAVFTSVLTMQLGRQWPVRLRRKRSRSFAHRSNTHTAQPRLPFAETVLCTSESESCCEGRRMSMSQLRGRGQPSDAKAEVIGLANRAVVIANGSPRKIRERVPRTADTS